jgi:L-seryl-tRNA(Ser) seleniumtransferase
MDTRRSVPSLDSLLRSEPGKRAAATLGRPLLKESLTITLHEAREAAGTDVVPPSDDEILAQACARASKIVTGLSPVINATGVVLHTGLGRAPISSAAAQAAARAAFYYTDLEVDRDTGARGRRSARAEELLKALTGAEDAMVVNNCAAALLLALATVAHGKQVLVSRGELIEIGGEFRIPDIMTAAGARLVEVGTTNRTRLADYRSSLTEKTAAILKVHPSNYRVVGFTAATPAKELAQLAHKGGLPFLFDVGSGLLSGNHAMPPDEPTVVDALAAGGDLVTFSGDKLLGGPQAGCIVGRPDLIDKLRRNPVARAVRVDKMQIAALEAVLKSHATGKADELPVHRMLTETAESVGRRAHKLADSLDGDLGHAHVHRCESAVGGGSMPGIGVPSWGVRLEVVDPPAYAARLRTGATSVFCRVEQNALLFDMRTVEEDQIGRLARAIQYALEGEDVEED